MLPAYQGQGIGQALMTRMLDRLGHLPNVDLLCDPDVVPFYERFGMKPVVGHGRCGGRWDNCPLRHALILRESA